MAEITGSLKHGPASEEQISALESQIGATLPEDYKTFLRTHNGGRPAPDAFLFINDFDEEEENIVECFFPVRTVDCGTRSCFVNMKWRGSVLSHRVLRRL